MKLSKDSVEVIAFDSTNISDLVQSITLYESIDGYLQGSIQILDGINFYDEMFGEYDRMMPIIVGYQYEGKDPIIINFALDGISDMKIEKSQKEYTMHLITSTEHSLKLTNINETYNGTSDEIIGRLWQHCLGLSSKLIIHCKAETNGKYIVPNIPAIDAVDNIINSAIDYHRTGFYLFQRVVSASAMTHLSSLKKMSQDIFKNPDGTPFEISNRIISNKPDNINSFGTSNQFTIEQYKMNHTDKIAKGFWGNNINHVRLDNSKIEKYETIEYTTNEITQYKISDKLYDYYTEPRGPHGTPIRYQQKSLFSNIFDPTDVASINVKRRMNENQLKIDDIVPIPNVGCGKTIKVALGGGNKSMSQADGYYLIADINHMFVRNMGQFDYTQSMILTREMA